MDVYGLALIVTWPNLLTNPLTNPLNSMANLIAIICIEDKYLCL